MPRVVCSMQCWAKRATVCKSTHRYVPPSILLCSGRPCRKYLLRALLSSRLYRRALHEVRGRGGGGGVLLACNSLLWNSQFWRMAAEHQRRRRLTSTYGQMQHRPTAQKATLVAHLVTSSLSCALLFLPPPTPHLPIDANDTKKEKKTYTTTPVFQAISTPQFCHSRFNLPPARANAPLLANCMV